MKIILEKNPKREKLDQLNVFSWPIWEKEISEFPWYYDEKETCYILDGSVVVTPENDDAVEINKGALVIFPQGMSCTWKITKGIKKHYKFG